MLFKWNADTIRWYLDANAYTGFYKNIAAAVLPMLDGSKTLCDLGCGLALFDFEVAPYLESVDCFDLSEAALASADERLRASGIGNVRTYRRDCGELLGQWDAAYLSFFGGRAPDRYLHLCKKLIAIVGTTGGNELFPPGRRNFSKITVDQTAQYLDEKGIGYRVTYLELEFGQPFSSLADARKFVKAYAPDITDGELEDFLGRSLSKTERADYPFYIPKTKAVGIFELDGALR